MGRMWLKWALAVVVPLAGSAALDAQALNQALTPPTPTSVIQTANPDLAASLRRIALGSLLWRNEVEALRPSRRQAFVVTPDQVIVADPASGRPKSIDRSVLAEVAILPDGSSGIAAVFVVVNLPLLEELHDQRRSLPVERQKDLDRILVHEVYGHAFPYLRAGDESGRCADPGEGERPENACSIRRENAVRAELGLGHRTDYGLQSLIVGRPTVGPYGLARFTY